MSVLPSEIAPWVVLINAHEGCEMRDCRNRQELSIEWNTEAGRPNLRVCRPCGTVLAARLMAELIPPTPKQGPPSG